MDSETKFTSGTVEVRTDDQEFAIDKSKYEAAVKDFKVSNTVNFDYDVN